MSTADSQVKCQSCERTAKVNFANCMREGWPMCCGSTMELMDTRADIRHEVGEIVDESLTGQEA